MNEFSKRLLSRKFLTGFFASLLLIFEKKVGLDLDVETKMLIAGVASSWILGESYVDASAVNVKQPEAERKTKKLE